MVKKGLNVLLSPVGFDSRNPERQVTDNVTGVIDIVTVPSEKGYIHVKPDLVYLFLTEESVENAKAIRKKYDDDKSISFVLDPLDNNKGIGFINQYDYKGIIDKLSAVKLTIEADHPDEDITYFINITPGTKIMTSAFSAMALFFRAYTWYLKDKSMMKGNDEPYILMEPPTPFDPSKLKPSRRKKVVSILSMLYRHRDTGLKRCDLYAESKETYVGLSAATISYNVNQMVSENLVSEPEREKQRKNSPIYITSSGIAVLNYLDPHGAWKGENNKVSGNSKIKGAAKESGTTIMPNIRKTKNR